MKGNEKVIGHLNDLLSGELTAAEQYFVQSRMFQNWGLNDLYERVNDEMSDELGHAEKLIERILFLEGTPDLSKRAPLNVGTDVPGMLRNNLDMEKEVVAALCKAIAVCESEGDYQTRDILGTLLEDTEEDHLYWLEKQLGLIEKMGLENYLQSQV